MADDSFEKVENFHLVLFLSRLFKRKVNNPDFQINKSAIMAGNG